MMRAKCSGAKRGMPSNSTSPFGESVSPMRSVPGSKTPMTSPGYASSTELRSCARNCCGAARRTIFPVRTCCTFIPRSKRPEHTRTNAMRSRCRGSMFAWILNTKPVNSGSSGSTMPARRLVRRRRRREIEELLEERLDAEVGERAAEEHRREIAREQRLVVERVPRGVEQPDLVHELLRARPRRAAAISAGSSSDRDALRRRVARRDRSPRSNR